jgi:putative oxidoreductase
MTFFRSLYSYQDEGLLIVRVGIGVMFLLHGWPKMMGGPQVWTNVGSAVETVGITGGFTFFGFMAAFAETVGGLFIALGLFFRFSNFLLFATMVVATMKHVMANDGFSGYSHALEAAYLFIGLFFIGPGRYSLDYLWFDRVRAEEGDWE